MAKLLIIEDDQELATSIARSLSFEHHLVELAADGSEGLSFMLSDTFDLAIVDWLLPGISGVEICRRYRSSGGTIPILILTGKSSIDDKESGFDSGADDYLTKPFDERELIARVNALLRRGSVSKRNTLTFGDLELDLKTYLVTQAGRNLQLTRKEFALLEFLMRHPKEVFSTTTLLDRVWHSSSDVTPDTVRVFVNRLRNKLGQVAGSPQIVNQFGAGYRLDV